MRRFFALATMAVLSVASHAQDGTQFSPDAHAVLTEREAVLANPPIALANDVMTAEWSPTGKFAMMVRRPPFPKLTPEMLRGLSQPAFDPSAQLTLSVWNRETKRTTDLGKVSPERLNAVAWFHQADVGLTFFSETKEIIPGQSEPRTVPGQLVWISPTTNQLRTLNSPIPGIVHAEIEPAPKGNLAIVYYATETQTGYFVVDATGRLIRTTPPKTRAIHPSWLPDGIHLAQMTFSQPVAGERPKAEQSFLNAQTGQTVERATLKLDAPQDDSEKPAELTLFTAQLNAPPTQKPNVLYLKGAENSTIALAMHASDATFSPKEDAVLYNEMGVATVRELTRIPKDLYLELKEMAMRTAAMSQAKQVATALIIYAADYDDVLPSQEDWENKVMPYIKSREMLSAFNYTFRGGDLSTIDKPHETELGYIEIPGGRVVAYADGHVKFISNPPMLAKDRPRRVHGTLASSG